MSKLTDKEIAGRKAASGYLSLAGFDHHADGNWTTWKIEKDKFYVRISWHNRSAGHLALMAVDCREEGEFEECYFPIRVTATTLDVAKAAVNLWESIEDVI